MAKKIIMSWSKCKIEVGKTGDDEAMAATLTDVGTINDKSTTLATEDGETLTATATGRDSWLPKRRASRSLP